MRVVLDVAAAYHPAMKPTELAAAIHAQPSRGVLAITGGGSGAIERLLATPGASNTVLEAIVPYAPAALADWIGTSPDHACDESTARAMAMSAWKRAQSIESAVGPLDLFGLGCTASLASNRPKRGDHRAHIAVQTARRTLRVSLLFEKGRRSRAEEEDAVAHACVAALADALGVQAMDLARTPSGIEVTAYDSLAESHWTDLLVRESVVAPIGGAPSPRASDVCLLPGSFNPLHEGHEEIAQIAAQRTGRVVVYELSIENVDKPPMDFIDLRERLTRLDGRPAWLTRAPTFVEKARLAPGVVFAVGADTMHRIAQPHYYASASACDEAIGELADLGARFLVFGRRLQDGFDELSDLRLPPRLVAICEGVPETEFRRDVSSSQIRGRESRDASNRALDA